MPVGVHSDSASVIIALDLGTTGNRAIAFDENGKLVCQSYQEFSQKFPQPGWVEHDPIEIYDTTKAVLQSVYHQLPFKSVVGIGIANQRETVVMWDKVTGKPLYNAIVWQCRRTSQRCDELSHHRDLIKQKTGLPIDPYFSATKIEWLLTHCAAVDRSRILVGTIDSWVVWQLTNKTVHITDHSNASRTMLYNIHTHDYDPELLELFQIPRHILPEIGDSSGNIATIDPQILGEAIPINAIIGDQQAALFCQCGTDSTALKNTYGTGLFVMASTGSTCIETPELISTIAWSISNTRAYALEGSVFGGGSTIQWLRDGLKMISTASETDALAASLDHNEGVYFVPALSGLGAPHWDPFARGMIIGLTRGTTTAHIARAALESIAYQTADVVEVMNSVVPGEGFGQLLVDGGAVENQFLLQFQSDVLHMPVHRPRIIETTAFGAALMAGLANGVWTERDIRRLNPIVHTVNPSADHQLRQDDYARWKAAVTRCLGWDVPITSRTMFDNSK
jgi:glycerol kinase